ncbi:MAG: protein kinase [Zavarzinella sp.]
MSNPSKSPIPNLSVTEETLTQDDGSAKKNSVTIFDPPVVEGEVGVLGPYRIIKELGHGGMGAVYATLDTRLDRKLALKIMLPEYASNSSAKERFIREARAAAKIKHDNIVTIYEADERNGIPYIAMEYLEGYPLDEYLKKKGSPSIKQIIRIAAETFAGLGAAHKQGLIHRDIKPGNLWLESPNARVKILDFGLAKPMDSEIELTKSGTVVGTPAYMSPEQARAAEIDHRSDLFSVGVMLYRLTTGKLPFAGPNTMAVLMALATEEPTPVREVNPDIPESLASLIHQLLAKNADNRPKDAAEAIARLKEAADELSGKARHTNQPIVEAIPVQMTQMVVSSPAANPFADIDVDFDNSSQASSTQTEQQATETTARRKGKQSSNSKAIGIAIGSIAALIVMIVAVVMIINNKGGSDSKNAVDRSKEPVQERKIPQKAPSNIAQPILTDPEAKAAYWVCSQGGRVVVSTDPTREYSVFDEIPRGKFLLTNVQLDNTKITDADLHNLQGLDNLQMLFLSNTALGDECLIHLKELKGLRFLSLGGTKVTKPKSD